MPSWLLKLFALFFLLPLAITLTDARTFRGIELPLEVGGFQRGAVNDNEAHTKGLGVTVAYGAPGIKATVFIYDLEIQNLPEGINNSTVQLHARQVLEDVMQAYPGAKVLEPLAAGSGSCARFLRAKFLIHQNGDRLSEPLHSYLYLGSARGNFIKIRLTYPTAIGLERGASSEARFIEAICRTANN